LKIKINKNDFFFFLSIFIKMMMRLLDWIDYDKINWSYLSDNPNAVEFLKANLDKIDWFYLSGNSNAIHLLEKNQDKINWNYLSKNPKIF
jgi:hypothetical protein